MTIIYNKFKDIGYKQFWWLPLVAIVIYIAFLVYPGGWSPDSSGIWAQVMGYHDLTTAKPYVFKVVWKFLYPLFGDGSMLVLHIAMYLTAIVILIDVLFDDFIIRIIASLFIGLFPPLLSMNLTIWTGTSALDSLMLSSALVVLYLYRSKNIYWLWLALFFALYGSLSRYNTISMLGFIVVLIAILISRYYFRKPFHKIGTVSIILAFLISWGSFIHYSNNIKGVKKVALAPWAYMQQLVGLSILNEKNFVPREALHKNIRNLPEKEILKEFKKTYKFGNNYGIWNKLLTRPLDNTYAEYAYTTFANNIGSYIAMQTRFNERILFSKGRAAFNLSHILGAIEWGVVWPNMDNPRYIKLEKFFYFLKKKTILYQYVSYFLISVIFLFLILSWMILTPWHKKLIRERLIIFYFSLAGIFLYLPLIPFINNTEFRYYIGTVYIDIFILLFCLSVFIKHVKKKSRDSLSYS